MAAPGRRDVMLSGGSAPRNGLPDERRFFMDGPRTLVRELDGAVHEADPEDPDLLALAARITALFDADAEDVDKLMCGRCGDWLDLEDIEGHLNSEGRTLGSAHLDVTALARALRAVAPQRMWPVRGVHEISNTDFARLLLAWLGAA